MNVIIIHGWGADSSSNWFPWLETQLKKKGHNVVVPDMPDTFNPTHDDWLDVAMNLTIDEQTVLVGHSLGTVVILRVLEKKKAKAAFLVAAFDKYPGIPELNSFFQLPFDYVTIRKNAKITMISSDNDPYIKLNIGETLSQKLECNHIVFHDKKHLSQGTTDEGFPELLEMILNEDN